MLIIFLIELINVFKIIKKGLKMSVLKNHFKDMSVEKKTKGRTKKTQGKRDKVYSFYCTEEELKELNAKAEQRHLSLSEYFRMKIFD